jgi:hypothetical protein
VRWFPGRRAWVCAATGLAMSQRRLPLTVVIMGIMAVGCASAPIPPPVAWTDLDAFLNDFSGSIAADVELRFVVLRVSDSPAGAYGPQALLRVGSREWTALPRRERDRLVRKASMLMLESSRPIQRRAPLRRFGPCVRHASSTSVTPNSDTSS